MITTGVGLLVPIHGALLAFTVTINIASAAVALVCVRQEWKWRQGAGQATSLQAQGTL